MATAATDVVGKAQSNWAEGAVEADVVAIREAMNRTRHLRPEALRQAKPPPRCRGGRCTGCSRTVSSPVVTAGFGLRKSG
jgi:hypothetical protein